MSGRAVILDRDGTLVDFHRDPEHGVLTPAFHPDQLVLLPGVIAGLRLLADAGYLLCVATNQPDAAKGRVPRAAIERTNQALCDRLARADVPIAALVACLHHPEGGPDGEAELIGPCACRKPAPGMIDALVARLGLDRSGSWLVGDTAADLGAAHAAGVRCALLVPRDHCELCPLGKGPSPPAPPTLLGARLDELAHAIMAVDRAGRA